MTHEMKLARRLPLSQGEFPPGDNTESAGYPTLRGRTRCHGAIEGIDGSWAWGGVGPKKVSTLALPRWQLGADGFPASTPGL